MVLVAACLLAITITAVATSLVEQCQLLKKVTSMIPPKMYSHLGYMLTNIANTHPISGFASELTLRSAPDANCGYYRLQTLYYLYVIFHVYGIDYYSPIK